MMTDFFNQWKNKSAQDQTEAFIKVLVENVIAAYGDRLASDVKRGVLSPQVARERYAAYLVKLLVRLT